MIKMETKGEKIFDVVNIMFMLIFVLVTLLPFLHVIFASFSSSEFILQQRGLVLWPKGFNIIAYKFALKNPLIGTSYRNTIFYSGAGTFIGLIIMSMAAYTLVKKGWPFKGLVLAIFLIPMFFGGGLIPSYINIKNLGLLDTVWVMFLPSCISTFFLIIMRTGFSQIPDSISESAYMDGANDFLILFRLIIPLSKATLAVIALFSIVGYWNSWFPALIFLRNRKLYPLQMILREVLIQGEMRVVETSMLDEGIGEYADDMLKMREVIKYATIVLSIGPVICAYPFLQRYFVKGVMIGSLKG